MNFEEQVIALRGLLERDARQGFVGNVVDLAGRHQERRLIKEEIITLAQQVRGLVRQYQHLPPLPDVRHIRWAQSVLACSAGCILTVDIDTAFRETTILHIHLLDFNETVLFDQVVAPGYELSPHTMHTWGLTSSEVQRACPLSYLWHALLEVVMGRYIVCYDLARIRRVFEDAVRHNGLEPLVLLGECLLEHAKCYFPASEAMDLSSLCWLIGSPLPELPDCTIMNRACGALHVLRAMAQGISTREESALPFCSWDENEKSIDALFL